MKNYFLKKLIGYRFSLMKIVLFKNELEQLYLSFSELFIVTKR